MGSGSYTAHDWDRLRKTRGITTDAGADNLFKNRTMLEDFNEKIIQRGRIESADTLLLAVNARAVAHLAEECQNLYSSALKRS